MPSICWPAYVCALHSTTMRRNESSLFVVFLCSPHFCSTRPKSQKSGFHTKNNTFTSLVLLLAVSCRYSICTLPLFRPSVRGRTLLVHGVTWVESSRLSRYLETYWPYVGSRYIAPRLLWNGYMDMQKGRSAYNSGTRDHGCCYWGKSLGGTRICLESNPWRALQPNPFMRSYKGTAWLTQPYSL